ncbi:hypothetical protein BU26DRAFT_311596 [Trematosphaeria pertusa]|uniref:Uncharacterized protein n=1 Tax=Trematosphaeria pertusa TaxID=390896 RepID=A0A6A6IGB4_9PLEO|nr:uncharacterized protein BU26DRAFT_311596 [Trematosphaeria pertusa]KAF2249078.1 hypothetical protein BU26DRAFT_311596 [Trematosphaeria pertusa]
MRALRRRDPAENMGPPAPSADDASSARWLSGRRTTALTLDVAGGEGRRTENSRCCRSPLDAGLLREQASADGHGIQQGVNFMCLFNLGNARCSRIPRCRSNRLGVRVSNDHVLYPHLRCLRRCGCRIILDKATKPTPYCPTAASSMVGISSVT